MPVLIQFIAAAGCREDSDGSFLLESMGGSNYGLPQLRIAPAGENIPHVFELEAQVTGLDPKASERLLKLYKVPGGRVKPMRARRWEEARTLPAELIDLSEGVPSEPVELTYQVHYYDSNANGQAIEDQPHTASLTIRLRVAQKEARDQRDEERNAITLRIRPEERVLDLKEEQVVQLVLSASQELGSEHTPSTQLDDSAGRLAPALRTAIETALRSMVPRKYLNPGNPGDPGNPGADSSIQWQLDLHLELDEAVRAQLRNQAGTPVRIPLISHYGGASLSHALSIDTGAAESYFPDWMCIDFGTSSSAVALFDQKTVPESVGLPKEQLALFAREMLKWLSSDGKEALAGQSDLEGEWRELLEQIGDGDAEAVTAPFHNLNEHRMLDIARRIETSALSPRASRVVLSRLNRILEHTFRTPPLSQETIFPVQLHEASRSPDIPSEVRLDEIDPLRVTIGDEARAARQAAEAIAPDTQGRFHIGYKQYLGTGHSFKVKLEDSDQPREIPYDDLISESWRELMILADRYRERNPHRHAGGKMRKAIITYPTTSPPAARRRIVELGQAIGIPSVEIAYDEAVAAAVFFVMRELGGTMDFGLEAFAARSRSLGSNGTDWAQNVLVFDIGGGTTDIALIRLTLRDETDPSLNDPARCGAGGRYYTMTPEVLGSSGHPHLGGNLISLKTLLGLKALLAEQLLERCEDDPRVSNIIASFSGNLLSDGGYATGRIAQRVFEGIAAEINPEENPPFLEALNAAEALIPTRWATKEGDPQAQGRARQTFNLLWDLAEEGKIALGGRLPTGTMVMPYQPQRRRIDPILELLGLDLSDDQRSDITLSLTLEQFEHLTRPSVQEAVQIARGLLESRLPRNEQLDWLILSGQTCRLALVDKELRRELESAEVFNWNPDKVTFDSDYAKLATSLGACWAEHLRVHVSSPKGTQDMLQRGFNQLHFKVKNLFFFLPCLFELRTGGGPNRVVFRAHDKLRKLDGEEKGKARSEWSDGATLNTSVLRKDFDGDHSGRLWCKFDATPWTKRWGMTDQEWRNEIRYQLEVDQMLEMRLLLCRGEPHFCVEPNQERQLTIPKERLLREPETPLDESDQGAVLACDLVVRLNAGGNSQVRNLVFKAGSPFDRLIHHHQGDSEPVKAMVSEPLPDFYRNGTHVFHLRAGGDEEGSWEKAGELSRPGLHSEFEQHYYATLDIEGTLTVHAGSVPYWTSSEAEVLRDQPGRVFALTPEDTRPAPNKDRDAFCGLH